MPTLIYSFDDFDISFYLACYDYGKEYIGWDITNTGIVELDPYSCHETCMKTRLCDAWTWYDNLCHLKRFKEKVKEKIGAVSGPKFCRKYIPNLGVFNISECYKCSQKLN